MYDRDVCEGMVNKYGHLVTESFYSKFFSGYFFCEKIDLCPTEEQKNYLSADEYAKKLLENKGSKHK